MTRVTKDLEGRRGTLTNGEQRITGKILSVRNKAFFLSVDGGNGALFPFDNWDFEPEAQPLPTEPGVYIPSTAGCAHGPIVFVLYGNGWRSTPNTASAKETALAWHRRVGLIRLVPERGAA